MGFTPVPQISIKIVIVCQEHRACDMSPACSPHITKMTKNCVSVWDMYRNGQLHRSPRLCHVCIGKLDGRRCLRVVCAEEMTAGPLMGLRWRGHKGERPSSDGSHSVLSAESHSSPAQPRREVTYMVEKLWMPWELLVTLLHDVKSVIFRYAVIVIREESGLFGSGIAGEWWQKEG